MAHPDEGYKIYWHEPIQRGIIPLETFDPPKNLKKLYSSTQFDYFINKDFEQVMRACAEREDTWISEEIIEAYVQLHDMGFAHSFETWQNGKLVGGLYGVSIGRAFFGESMFHRTANASKVALCFLVEYLKENNFLLLDTQFLTPHLQSLGGVEIPQTEYLKLLEVAL